MTRMMIKMLAAAACALASWLASSAQAQQTLDNGYRVVRLRAESPTDRTIVDMNDSGQVLAWTLLIRGDAAFFDANKRLAVTPPSSLPLDGVPTTVDSVRPFAVSNDATVAIWAIRGQRQGEPGTTNFLASRQFVTADGPVICGGWRPPCGIGGGGDSWQNALGIVGARVDSRFDFQSMNKRTNEIMFASNFATEIHSWTSAGLRQVLSIGELPAQYRGTGRFWQLVEGSRSNNLNGNFHVFDDGSVAFVSIDAAAGRMWVLEADKNKNIRELFSAMTTSLRVSANESRQLAFVQNGDAVDRPAGVYFHDQTGTRQIHTITNHATTRYGQFIDINESGEVVFEVFIRATPTVEYLQLLLWNPRNGALTPLATNMPAPTPGANDQLYVSNPIDSWAFNNRGQLSLASTINQVSRNEPIEFFRLDPPGVSLENVLMPGDSCAPDRFCFTIVAEWRCGRNSFGPIPCNLYIDPIVAIGFDYEAKNAESRFSSVSPPDVGDGRYDLYFWDAAAAAYVDTGIDIMAGETLEFASLGFANGVDRFSLRGIETDANVDPDDPLAFVTGITFAAFDGAKEIEMIPVRFDTDAVAPTVEITAPANGATLFASSFPAGVTASFNVGHDPLTSVNKATLAVDGAPVASATRPFAGGVCAPSTVGFDTCGVAGPVGTLGDRFVVNGPGAYEISATAETDGGPGAARSTVSIATINVEYPAPPSVANAYISELYKKMTATCRGSIVNIIATRHGHIGAYGPKGGPYDLVKIRGDVDALKTQLGC